MNLSDESKWELGVPLEALLRPQTPYMADDAGVRLLGFINMVSKLVEFPSFGALGYGAIFGGSLFPYSLGESGQDRKRAT